MRKKSLDDYDHIDEDKIRSMAATAGKDNTFIKLLSIADEWRAAGCTPVFIVASQREDDMIIGCVAEETFGRYLQ